MKSRTSEKPTTKSTTSAKSAKKPVKKSVRASAKKTVSKKAATKTATKREPPTKAVAKRLPIESAGVETAPPPPQPEPVAPPATPPQASDQAPPQASDQAPDQVLEQEASPASTPPVFVKRDLTGPDGSTRPGWEMWIGDHCFGRADSKDLLLASFERLQSPPSSFHWREVRNRMPMRGRAKRPSVPPPPATGQVAENDGGLLDELSDVAETPEVS